MGSGVLWPKKRWGLGHQSRFIEQPGLMPQNISPVFYYCRFFLSREIYRRKGGVRKWTRGLTPWWRGPWLGRAALGCGQVLAPLRLCFGLRLVFWKNRRSAFVSSNSENISYVAFLKHKNNRKQGTGTVASR
jgi:hypothetical protein